jgi:hypothetical protein
VRLLLDAAFPEAAEGMSRPAYPVERWRGGDASDRELLEAADTRGFTGVVFVGTQVLARRDVVEAASRLALQLVVTTSEDPHNAQRDLGQHLAALAKESNPKRVAFVSSRGVAWEPLK